MKFRKTTAAAVAVLALVATVTACGSGSASGGSSRITIGIKFDQPGLGLKTPDGTYTGFDVDVARYIAGQLGYDENEIEWRQAPSAERENLLARGDVDLIVASYSITPERKDKVDFAGPYFLAHQDLMIRSDEKAITKATDLNSKKLCSVTGSTSARNVQRDFAPKADLQQYGGYSECLTGLENGNVDALTTDDSILAGYAAQKENQGKFKLAGLELSDENYGIGLKKGDTELQSKVNKAIRTMEQDGSWQKFVTDNFGPAHYHNEPAPKITETG
jgi:glutamate transport system substrate-binding protein